jgi:uncharacterized membrane protein YeaQ/YmgE (transglycosylase-associated protein family)
VILKQEKPRRYLSLSSDLVLGYVGAWLGTPVFGRWVEGISYQNVSIIPALLGAIAILVLETAYCERRAG